MDFFDFEGSKPLKKVKVVFREDNPSDYIREVIKHMVPECRSFELRTEIVAGKIFEALNDNVTVELIEFHEERFASSLLASDQR